MKKEELNELFKKELNDITVSDELKSKTLNSIKNSKNVLHFPYLKNVCAIFIVSLICFCVYNSKIDFSENKTSELSTEYLLKKNDINQDNSVEGIQEKMMQKSLRMVPILESEIQELSDNLMYDENYLEINDEKNIYSEEQFLIDYPNALKTNEGYIVKIDNKEKLYIFENGFLKSCTEIK